MKKELTPLEVEMLDALRRASKHLSQVFGIDGKIYGFYPNKEQVGDLELIKRTIAMAEPTKKNYFLVSLPEGMPLGQQVLCLVHANATIHHRVECSGVPCVITQTIIETPDGLNLGKGFLSNWE